MTAQLTRPSTQIDYQDLVTTAQDRANKCKAICDGVLGSNDLEKINIFAENCKQAIAQMQANRKPITAKFDEIKKMFTSTENEVEQQRQRALSKISEIKTAQAREAAKRKEIETYDVRILDHLKAYCQTFADGMYKALKEVNAENYQEKQATLSQIRFKYDRRHFNTFRHIEGVNLDAKYDELNEIFQKDMDRLRSEMLSMINNVKIDFKETEKAKVEKIKQNLTTGEDPFFGKALYKIEILNVLGVIDLFTFWMDEEGKFKEVEDTMTMSIERMKTFAEKMASKGVFIDAPDALKYEEYYK